MSKKALRSYSPKNIVYLMGAGATQAEVIYRDAAHVNLLMKDSDELGPGVSTSILRKSGQVAILGAAQGTDIEKLIALLSSTGVSRLVRLAERMRRLYFQEIVQRLARAKIIATPKLACALVELHANPEFNRVAERLRGVLTTNHDGLLQVAFSKVHGAINLGIPFQSTDFANADPGSIPPLLQLHGSLSWRFGMPTQVARLRRNSTYMSDTTWIPPTVTKESRIHPFNKLAGHAYELLAGHCDVLRVIGASMTQNDWNVLSLIFTAQKNHECHRGKAFRIELIMPHERGVELQEECSFLKNLTPLGYLTDGKFSDFKDYAGKPHMLTSKQRNPFAYWLNEKILFHRVQGDLGRDPLGKFAGDLVGSAT